uniref:RNA-directed DNA polymerase n=1 Tax=Bombyx mori TaxID=7091 RepID=A0A8R2QZ29_BOMMO|nr:uncharacterized protein LOC105842320 isoform X2 [Bombyx mori]
MARRRSKSQSFDDDDSIFDRPTRGGMFHLTENIIRKFDGKDKTYAVTKWIQDIEENGDIFEWTPKQRLLVARRSLTGTAALWLNSEKTFPCWDTLKIAISKEFPDTIDAKTIHEMMSAKKKKSNESCIDYMFAMKELGRRGKMADYVAIKYVVDGIQDQEINKIMLYGVTTYAELKEKLKIYEILKEKMKKEPIHGKEQKITNTREWSSKVRCYSCGEKSHKSEDCPKKMQGKKCFNCNVFGHISSQCPAKAEASSATASSARTEQQPKRTYIATTQEGANTIFENQSNEVHNAMNAVIGSANSTVRDKCHNSEVDILKVNKECKVLKKTLKLVKLCNNNEIHALIDTGSEVNLVTMDYYEQIGSPTCFKNVNTVLTGLGSSKVISTEQFKTNIEIDGYTYRDIIFYVIPRDSIPIKVILGHEFLRNVITVMKDGLVWMKPNDWLFKVNCFPCSIDIVGHVMNENVRNEVTRLVDEYRPCQTKEAPIELKITLKDDIPVAQRPRRISPKEQDEVDKQVKEWLEQGVIRVSFSEYTSPIVLVRKDKQFEFNNEHRLVFNMLKEKLTSNPVLKIYEPKAETELHTDASSIAYAAILLQKDDNSELHPVHYMSKRTTDAESKYTSYELEALAIIEGIKKFRHYLYGKHFKIVTDCKAFQMTLNKKDLAMSTRVARWILFLQDYDFTIEHREGSKMKHTDALSRNPYVALIFSDLHSDLRRAQESDNGLNAIINILRDGKLYNDFYLQGLLCKGPQHCLVVPQKMEIEIIKRAHDNGHFSKKKTLELINKDYYIPKLEKKIEDYIATCIPCLLASRKEDIQLLDLLMEEERHNFIDSREELRKEAKKQIFKVQEENRRNYNKKMKECTIYKEGDLVAVKRTQFGTGMKLKPKFLGPYRIVKVKRKNRYNVEKADAQVEGPNKTTTSADFMKKWPDYLSD